MQVAKSQVKSNNLSIKLLKTIGGQTNNKRGINGLAGLANRIKLANNTYKSNQIERESIKQQLLDDGIDLNKDKIQAMQIFQINKERTIIAQQVKEVEVQFSSPMKDLKYEQFAHKAEQNLAYRGIYETLMVQRYIKDPQAKPESRLKQLRRRNLNRMKTAKEQIKEQMFIEKRDSETKKDSFDKIAAQFGRCLCQTGVQRLHEQLYRTFQKKDFIYDNEHRKWIHLLFQQIEIADLVYQAQQANSILNRGRKIKNYVATVSISALNEIFEKMYSESNKAFQTDYFIDAYNHPQKMKWSQYYVSLLTGKITDFTNYLKSQSKSLAQQYDNLLFQINEYERPKIPFSDIAVNNNCNFFQRILKLIVLGKFEPVFRNVLPKIRALQQPWFILMSLGFPKTDESQENNRKKQLKLAISDYYDSVIQQVFREKLDGELVSSFITGLTSLNNFTLLLKFYDQLTERQYLQNYPFYLDFVHLFILLAANPSLLYLQLPKFEAESVLERCLSEIVVYLKQLKVKNNGLFKPYFASLLQILGEIAIQHSDFSYEELIQKAFSDLNVKTQDIESIRKTNPDQSVDYNRAVTSFQGSIIRHIHPKKEEQFINLASFCDLIDQPKLQEHILVKMIIFDYQQRLAQQKPLETTPFQQMQTQPPADSPNIAIAIDFLKQTMNIDQIQILNFLLALKRLTSLLHSRRKDLLRKEQSEFRKYRESNQRILNYLANIDPNSRSGYLDIFVHYYQQLLEIYSLIHFSSSSLDLFYKERTSMTNELNRLKQNYPSIVGAPYNKLMQMLNHKNH